MTKKKVFWGSLIGVIVYLILVIFWQSLHTFCFTEGHCWKLWNVFKSIADLLHFLPIIFLLSLITYFLREEIFRAWLHFAYFWIPISLFFVYLASGSSGGGFGIPNVFDQESVSIIFSGLFAVISLVIIIIKSLFFKKKSL